MVIIIKAIKIGLYGRDMAGIFFLYEAKIIFLFNSILKLEKNIVKVF